MVSVAADCPFFIMAGYSRRPLLERFNKWYKIDYKTGCWNWFGNKYLNG